MTSKYFYRPDIDGLRAIAVLAVILFHLFPNFIQGGFVGVDIFFVISGYVITKHISTQNFCGSGLLDFYSRRAKRIFPALFIVLATVYIIGWIELLPNEFSELAIQITAASSFVGNLLFWHQAGYFDTTAQLKPLLHTWSLGVEEQFYLIWPMLILIGLKYKIRPIRIALVALIGSFFLNVLLSIHSPTADFYSPIARFWEIMIGCILALAKSNLPDRFKSKASIFGALLIFISIFFIRSSQQFPGYLALLPTIGCALIIASDGATGIGRVLSNRILVFIGLISYPLYLWHWPLLVFAKIASYDQAGVLLRIFVFITSIVLATLTYRFVEKPIRFSLPSRKSAMVASIAILTSGVVGTLTFFLHGIPDRAISNDFATIVRPSKALQSDGSCNNFFGISALKNETCIAKSDHPGYLIIGDSHAMALNSAVVDGMIDVNTMVISGSSCPPFAEYMVRKISELDADRNCDLIVQQAIESAKKIKSIHTVFLVSMGPDYFTDEEFNGAKIIGWTMTKNNVPVKNKERAFVDGYSDMVRRLLKLGKRVVFIVDVPEIGFDPSECVRRPISFSAENNCYLPRKNVDERQRRYRALIDEIALDNPALTTIDPTDAFCNSVYCNWKTDGEALYFDMHHLTLKGSALALNSVFKKLLHTQLYEP